MKNMIISLLLKYQINSITFFDIPSGGLIYLDDSKAHIILNINLSRSKALFALLHEVGHLALQILPSSPVDKYSPEDEFKINNWVIDQISDFFSFEDVCKLKEKFKDSEHSGYQFVEELFDSNNISLNIFEEFS